MKTLPGVNLGDLDLAMRQVLVAADKVWKRHGQELVVTCTGGGIHSPGSLHYYGLAVDLRTRYFSSVDAGKVRQELAEALDPRYNVLLETGAPHIHVEFDFALSLYGLFDEILLALFRKGVSR